MVYSPDEGVEDLVPLVHGITKIVSIWGVWVVEKEMQSSKKRSRPQRHVSSRSLQIKKVKKIILASEVGFTKSIHVYVA